MFFKFQNPIKTSLKKKKTQTSFLCKKTLNAIQSQCMNKRLRFFTKLINHQSPYNKLPNIGVKVHGREL